MNEVAVKAEQPCERSPMAARFRGFLPVIVDVETGGELTRGMTVFDRRGIPLWQTNIDVLTAVDAQGVLDYFARILRGTQ